MAAKAPDPVGTLAQALAHTERLIDRAPALAVEQAGEILKAVPEHPGARLLLGIALRHSGDPQGARSVLAELTASRPGWAAAQTELGQALVTLGEGDKAISTFRLAVAADADHGGAWLALADALRARGDVEEADAAYAQHIRASIDDPALMRAASALCDNDLPVAERLLRDHLKRLPTDVVAIRMLAELAGRIGRYDDAENLLARCLELAPGFDAARHNYALVLQRQNKAAEALVHIDALLAKEPANPGYRALKAATLVRIGDYGGAIALYEGMLAANPDQPKIWMSYGHALKTFGRSQDGIAAYRSSLAQQPGLGESWWSLANLKTFRFGSDDIAAMQAQLGGSDIGEEDRFHLHFALGKALEDAGDYAGSFDHYAQGNALRRPGLDYDADRTSRRVARARALFTPEFLADHAGQGCPAPDPIFILGMPRAGSTLIEQILSSHSLVEGTMELPDMDLLAKRIGERDRQTGGAGYPDMLARCDPAELAALGQEYLDRTRIVRPLGRPFFIDKMPNNWLHTGLIHLILPNAKIIDARRHPLGCCFSAFKQHFARGQGFSYALEDVGRYYADYVGLMAHFDSVLPGRVHRVIYERLVDATESEVRRLLDYCHLPFEDSCLRFHETDRAVRTASSEQVRQPIFRDAKDHWRNYEPWLKPLKSALGTVLDAYPDAPAT